MRKPIKRRKKLMWKFLGMDKVRELSEKHKTQGKNNRRPKTTEFGIRNLGF